jgi:two-component system, cell cycle response regulator DivK
LQFGHTVREQAPTGSLNKAMTARILYVEDNEDNIYLLTRRLSRGGYEVLIARDGQAGIDAAVAESPDLILMDLDLPVMDGWEAARRLKSMADVKRIPIIALTSHAMTGDEEKALAAGCDDYDTKPIDFPRLQAKISSLIHGQRPDEQQ